jgi:hypothetical protein
MSLTNHYSIDDEFHHMQAQALSDVSLPCGVALWLTWARFLCDRIAVALGVFNLQLRLLVKIIVTRCVDYSIFIYNRIFHELFVNLIYNSFDQKNLYS